MENIQVSIVMPVFNSNKYLSEAIESVLQQTFTSWELIIVDDHSTDGSINIIKKYAHEDSRIIPIFYPRTWEPPPPEILALHAGVGDTWLFG